MLHTIRIKGFKRFGEVELRLPGHVVLAGPNNMGKTTVLQAIASWAFALRRWRELNDFNPRNGYGYAPISRPAFTTVPLRSFDLLWRERAYQRSQPIEIELRHSDGWAVAMEFMADTTEQIFVRPKAPTNADLRTLDLRAVYIPPMSGPGIDEPLFQPPKVDQLLSLGRPGEALRNLIAEASQDPDGWTALEDSIFKLFGDHLPAPRHQRRTHRRRIPAGDRRGASRHREFRQRLPASPDAIGPPQHAPRLDPIARRARRALACDPPRRDLP